MDNEIKSKLMEKVTGFYEKAFGGSEQARNHLASEGITDNRLYERHRIGYSDGSLLKALPQQGRVIDDLKSIGILNQDGTELFNGCITFPIADVNGTIVNIAGINMATDEKVILDNKGLCVWNIAVSERSKGIIATDSIIDALILETLNITDVIAVLSKDAVKLPKNAKIKKLEVPDGMKLSEYIKKYGTAKVGNLIDGINDTAVPEERTGNGFAVSFGMRRYEIISPVKTENKLRATVRITKAGKTHVDTVDFYNHAQTRRLTKEICIGFSESAEVIESDMGRLVKLLEKDELYNDEKANHVQKSFTSSTARERSLSPCS